MHDVDPDLAISRALVARDALVIGDDEGFLDAATPTYTPCNGPFQTHKRFKLNMLPTMTDVANGEYGKGVDLVFNLEGEGGSRRYQVMQKVQHLLFVKCLI